MNPMNLDDSELFAVPDIAWQSEPPPVRHPIPVQYAPDLAPGDDVSAGIPGRAYLDGLTVTDTTPMRRDVDGTITDALSVTSRLSWLLSTITNTPPILQWWPLDRLWTYRDALPAPTPVPTTEATWLDHVRPDLNTPPPRTPRPARAALPLSGRTLRVQGTRGTWSWWAGASEPYYDDHATIRVQCLPRDAHHLAHLRADYTDLTRPIAIHRLYTY